MTNWMYLYLCKVHILDISSVVGINPCRMFILVDPLNKEYEPVGDH